jgi:PAS domain S-box-containing protein
MTPLNILCVDDDLAFLRSLEKILSKRGFRVSAVPSVPEALELIGEDSFDVLVADLNIGEPGDGFILVNAMRRANPRACTFIVTGYPDIDSAIKAIQNQVDDYFTKPLNIDQLLNTISAIQNGNRPTPRRERPRRVSELIQASKSAVIQDWLMKVLEEPEIASIPLSDTDRIDHLPELLDELVERLEGRADELTVKITDAARKHGRVRFNQGYTIPQILFETRILEEILRETIQNELLKLELSSLVSDVFEIGIALQAALEISVRSYQAQAPRSLQTSFSTLYKSPYLGVAICDGSRIIDANDALLKMMGFSREQLIGGEIDWFKMTPEKFRSLDMNALEQLREFGTCVPFEKEVLLRDGSVLPFLIGAVRLSLEPLQWSAYVVDLTKQRKLHDAEQIIRDSDSRYRLINQLAHEINNPLAALTFTLHLLGTHADLPANVHELLRDSDEMLNRIAESVKMVSIETRPGPGDGLPKRG